jgi:hypothetical protein
MLRKAADRPAAGEARAKRPPQLARKRQPMGFYCVRGGT